MRHLPPPPKSISQQVREMEEINRKMFLRDFALCFATAAGIVFIIAVAIAMAGQQFGF